MKSYLLLCLSSTLIACSNSNNGAMVPTENANTQQIKAYTTMKKVKIQDPEQYNSIFLESMTMLDQEVLLEHDYIVLNNDTIHFPLDLTLNKEYHFTATDNDGRVFELTLTRQNLTNLKYHFTQMEADGTLNINMLGLVILYPKGILTGNEIDEDDIDGESYASNVYYDSYPDHCLFLRVGAELDNNGAIRAKIFIESSNEMIPELQSGPILRSR